VLDVAINNQNEKTRLTAVATKAALERAEALAAHNQAISNEFRGQLKDQAERFPTREELKSTFDILNTRLEAVAGIGSEFKEFRSAAISNATQKKNTTGLLLALCTIGAGLIGALGVILTRIFTN